MHVNADITVRRTPNNATVTVTMPSGVVARVDVFGPREAFGGHQGAEVNWSAIGSVSPADATAYAEAIVVAVREADAMDFNYRVTGREA